MSVFLPVIWFIDIAANCFGFSLHILGVFAILKCKRKTNTLCVLLNLGFLEAFLTAYGVGNDVYRVVKYENDEFNSSEIRLAVVKNDLPAIYQEINLTLYYASGFELVLICLVLVIDRLVCVQYPFKHKVHFTRHKLKIVLISTWCVSGVMGVIYGVFSSSKYMLILIFTCIAFAYFVLAVFTYSLILYKIKHSLRLTSSKNSEDENDDQIRFSKQYMIPALIISTYFIFYAVPSLIQRYWVRTGELTFYKFVIHECLAILIDFGFIFDALTYVFLMKYLRKIISRQFCLCLSCQLIHEESSTFPQETQEQQV